MDLSIIIVNYNTSALIQQCLNSILNIDNICSYEIIVVDNNSQDNSVDIIKNNFPFVKLIVNYQNEGFAKANNKGIRQSQGRYILLLNSDTIVLPGAFQEVINFMDNDQSIGATGCKVIRPNGKLDLACRRSFHTPEVAFYRATGLSKLFPRSKRFGRYNLLYLDENETYEVDCIMGAYMMVRRETIEDVGVLDEDYFMYCEDADWCYRIKSKGWKIYYFPEATIIHLKGESTKKQSFRMIIEFHKSQYIYYRKNHAKENLLIINLLLFVGIFIRLGLVLLINCFRRNKRVSK